MLKKLFIYCAICIFLIILLPLYKNQYSGRFLKNVIYTYKPPITSDPQSSIFTFFPQTYLPHKHYPISIINIIPFINCLFQLPPNLISTHTQTHTLSQLHKHRRRSPPALARCNVAAGVASAVGQ